MLKQLSWVLHNPIKRRWALPSSIVLPRKHPQEQMQRQRSDIDDISYDLTKNEALTYLEDVLEIADPINFVKENKVDFLKEMMRQTKLKIPYTNITAVTFTEDGIRLASLEEHKRALFKQQGGYCLAINSFTSVVLQSLGFETYLIGGSIYRWRVPLFNNHTAVITKHLTAPGSLHLVDVGTQYFLPLISLDFDRISQVYPIRGSKYRLFQVSPGVVQLTRKCNPPKPGQAYGLIYIENEEFWEVLTTFRTLIPRKLAECHFQTEMVKNYPELAPGAGDNFWLFGYPNNLFIVITNKHCMTVTEAGHTEVTHMKNSTQVIDTILEHFPQYSRDHLEKMADYFAKILREKATF